MIAITVEIPAEENMAISSERVNMEKLKEVIQEYCESWDAPITGIFVQANSDKRKQCFHLYPRFKGERDG